jgi:hypothetical protein
LVGTQTALAESGDADAILKAMTDYVSSQKTIELRFDSTIEVITPQLEKIQFTNSGGALLSRPDKLRAHRIGGYSDVEMIFDGETVGILGKHLNGYSQFELSGGVDQLVEALHAGHGIAFPGADLLLSNAYEVLSADILEAKHVGLGVIGGELCEHLAFRNFDTDWQLWVRAGDAPIPCKLVITSKTINNAPQYSVTITEWKTDVTPAADAFTFRAPSGAQPLDPNALIELDELPLPAGQDTSTGDAQ